MSRYFEENSPTDFKAKYIEEKLKRPKRRLKDDKKSTSDLIRPGADKNQKTYAARKNIGRTGRTEGKSQNISPKKKSRRERDPFPGDKPIPREKLAKYKHGRKMETKGIKTRFQKTKFQNREKKFNFAVEQAARSELLLGEESGYIQKDDDEDDDPSKLTQHQLAAAVDITSATKFFELNLRDFGPYTIDYTRNGRHLLIGGRKGHVAAMDWVTKKLHSEINVMEEIQAVKWLHQETMYAVAQKKWLFIYDNQGTEIHCIKELHHVLQMEFLPYHFLLATSNEKRWLSWLDVSRGQMAGQFPTKMGRLDVMTHNPFNATVILGHPQGVVTMWSPTVKEPLLKMLCHNHPLRAVTVDSTGKYMATASVDRSLKIWDLRNNYKCVQSYQMGSGASRLSFSQTGLLAASVGNTVEIYKDCCKHTATGPYLRHKTGQSIAAMKFCPYEDVLGVGHYMGVSSLLVPGAGEANFDALESNPFQTKSQRKEAEVKSLLEKIQPEMITLDPSTINKIHLPTLKDKLEQSKKFLFVKPPKLDFTPREKTKGRGGSAKSVKRKKGVQEEEKLKFVREVNQQKQRDEKEVKKPFVTSGCLLTDRFKKKKV